MINLNLILLKLNYDDDKVDHLSVDHSLTDLIFCQNIFLLSRNLGSLVAATKVKCEFKISPLQFNFINK